MTQQDYFIEYFLRSIREMQSWKAEWFPFDQDSSLDVDPQLLENTFSDFISRLGNSYPFFHPSYIGQMLKPSHPVAMLAYFTAMQINPNNHALDGGPATSEMEKEVVAEIAKMFGYGGCPGHLTSSGTIANLEALWVSREIHPDKYIAFSEQAHYTHRRMCEVLNAKSLEILANNKGEMNIDALHDALRSGNIGTVVSTLGTTASGALDPIDKILELQKEFHFRIHVDAAYGGFFTLLAHDSPSIIDPTQFLLLSQCDSIVIDPHKHGLQPYGCGCVLFRDPSVGKFYKHDSPYTYFTSKELHLGEISLECSRAGASAAALWFTMKCIPFKADEGLGPILRQCRNAAREWSEQLKGSLVLSLLFDPALDIVAFFPRTSTMRCGDISRMSDALFERAMHDPVSPKYLSKLRLKSTMLASHHPDVSIDAEYTTVLRSVLMKPEHRMSIPRMHEELERLAKRIVE